MNRFRERRPITAVAWLILIAIVVIVIGVFAGWWDKAASQERSPYQVQPSEPPASRLRKVPPVPPAQAIPACMPHAAMLEVLRLRHGELPHALGLLRSDHVMEVLSSKQGSFTVLIVKPTGEACIMAGGLAYETIPDHLRMLDPGA